MNLETIAAQDTPINVHDGCSLMPFSFIQMGSPRCIRYTIRSLLEIEQLFCRSLRTIIEQALIGTLGEEEQYHILWLGLDGVSPRELNSILDTMTRDETARVYKQSQFELIRAIGADVIYNEVGEPVNIEFPKKKEVKRADVRDVKDVLEPTATFSQWYEQALTSMFRIGTTIPISELLLMTPIELRAYLDCHDFRLVYLRKSRIAQAYHTAAFMSNKDTPPLDQILRRIDREAGRPTESKFTENDARKIIETDKRRAEYALEKLGLQSQPSDEQATQSTDGDRTKGETKWKKSTTAARKKERGSKSLNAGAT